MLNTTAHVLAQSEVFRTPSYFNAVFLLLFIAGALRESEV